MAEKKKAPVSVRAGNDIEALAMLYDPKPGSGLPNLRIVKAIPMAPRSPQELFELGDPSALADLLRSDAPLTPEVRTIVAGIIDGSVKRPRGNKRMRGLSQHDASMIRNIAKLARDKKINYKDVLTALALFYKRSEGNMRDVIEFRGKYAEK